MRGRQGDLQALSWRSQIAERMFGVTGSAVRIADRYRLGREIGRGGMGIVCRARDERLGRDVAIKLARPRQTLTVEVEDRLRNEARALAALSHPNVVSVYDVGLHDGHVFIAMELVDGPSLRAWLAESSRDADAIIDVMLGAGYALAAAHESLLVHRDFKPDNLLVGADGRARVVDFGLAVAIGELTTAHDYSTSPTTPSEHGLVAGTPLYMPPEVWSGVRIDALGDQFAFCAAFREALDGVHPFCHRGRERVLQCIAAGDVGERPSSSKAPRWLTAMLDRGLSLQPQERWPSMLALLRAIERRRGRNRRGAVYVAALGVVGVLAIAALTDDQAPCSGGETSVAAVWSPARAEALRDRIDPNSSSHAAASWNYVEAGMSAFSTAWADARRAACEIGRSDEASPRALDATVACLDAQLREVDAFVDALTRAHDPARYAAEAIDGIAPPRMCAEQSVTDVPPATGEELPLALRVDGLLARSRGAAAAGDYTSALELAREAVELSTAMQHAPTRGAALLQLGTALELTGSFAEAAERTEQALLVAIGAEDDRLAVRAATSLTFIVGERMARPEQAEAWVRHAEVALARLDHPQELELELWANVAALRRVQGRNEEAADGLARTLAGRRTLHGDRSLAVAAVAHNYALVLFDLGRFDEALELSREVIAIREALIGPEHPLVATTHLAVGASLARVGRLEDGLAHFERALAISEASLGPEHQQTLAAAANLGVALRMHGDTDRAVLVLARARAALRNNAAGDHPLLATVCTGLGGALEALGRHEEAIEVLEEALAIFERLHGGEDPGSAAVLGNLGNVYLATGQYERARDSFERAQRILAPLGATHPHYAQASDGVEMARAKLAENDPAPARQR